MSKTSIEWTEATWNPIVGCSILTPGCIKCYAMGHAARQIRCAAGLGRETHYEGTVTTVKGKPVWTGKLALAPDSILLQPLKRKKPTTYFVNSMSDLFHENAPDEWIDRVFAVMALSPQHTFQVLTKRAKRMREYLTKPHMPGKFITIGDDGEQRDTPGAHIRTHSAMCDIMPKAPARALNEACAWQDKYYPDGDGFIRCWPLPNVWLGVSTERQQEADERIPELLQTPAAVRFISAEPLLGPIDLTNLGGDGSAKSHGAHGFSAIWRGNAIGRPWLDWVIVGGESGPGARPMHPDWARSLRDQCAAAGVPFFFKQFGEWLPCAGDEQRAYPTSLRGNPDNHESAWPDGTVGNGHKDRNGGFGYPLLRVGKKRAGRLLDGVEHNGMPGAAP